MAMTCFDCEGLIDKLACRDIESGEREQLTDHILTCAPCSHKYKEAENFVDLMVAALHSVPATSDPKRLERSLEKTEPFAIHRRWVPWAVAASLLIGLAVVWLIGRSGQEGEFTRYARVHTRPAIATANLQELSTDVATVLPKYLPDGFKLTRTIRVDRHTAQLFFENAGKNFSLFEEPPRAQNKTIHEERTIDQSHVILHGLPRVTIVLVSSDLDFDELRKILYSLAD